MALSPTEMPFNLEDGFKLDAKEKMGYKYLNQSISFAQTSGRVRERSAPATPFCSFLGGKSKNENEDQRPHISMYVATSYLL